MASITLVASPTFTSGTVTVYRNWRNGALVSGAPAGAPVTTAAVAADGTVSLTGLSEDVLYVLYQASPDRYLSFMVDDGLDASVVVPVVFAQGGSAVVGVSPSWRAPVAGSIVHVSLATVGAPVGSPLTVAFVQNGTTIATLTIPAGSTTEQNATLSIALAAGDRLWVNATSVGSTTPAQAISAQIDCQ